MSNLNLPRRSFLHLAALTAVPRLSPGMQEVPSHSLGALLDGSGMVPVRPGKFLMGSANGLPDEAPAHTVRITRGFEIGKFEVTQSQWQSVMREPHAKVVASAANAPESTSISADPSYFKGPRLPVHNVSWDDVQHFLTKLNARDARHLYRLPTEAEWEYACLANAPEQPAGFLKSVGWFKENSGEQVRPVGEKEPNAWGLHDTQGNVAEWVQDWYGPDYYAHSPAADPTGPRSGSYRVYRGGCWFDAADSCRPSLRTFDFPISRFYNVGFRVVRTAR